MFIWRDMPSNTCSEVSTHALTSSIHTHAALQTLTDTSLLSFIITDARMSFLLVTQDDIDIQTTIIPCIY